MRITQIRATPIVIPYTEDERWAYGSRRGLTSVIVHVDTDEGLTGVGEASAYPSAGIVLAVLDSIKPLAVGEDPFRIEHICNRINIVGTWHHVKMSSPAIAAVETACWDIVGKACGQPLVNLFGGRVRDEVEYFYLVNQKSPGETKNEATKGASAGFTTFYLKAGSGNPSIDIERVAAIRDGAGPDARIRVDANESWSPATALRTIKEMEKYGLEYAEQPTSGRNLTELAYIRSRIDTPLLANEASWTRFDQLEVIRHGAADAISVDNQMDGGLLNLKRAAGICETAGLPVVKHSLGELAIAQHAAMHVIAATPNFLLANQGYKPYLDGNITEDGSELPYRNGKLPVPSKPGIGVTLNEDRIAEAADLYQRASNEFTYRDPKTMTKTPSMPKI
jgi:L-alanine-DL-glutamate epimerase-like enolase superfamily enzyme